VIALLARNLEADETETVSRDNRLPTFAAHDHRPKFHNSLLPFVALPFWESSFRSVFRSLSVFSPTKGHRGQPRTRRALLYPALRVPWRVVEFLLIVAEEEVVGTVRHEHLLAHVAGQGATCSGSRSTLGVKALDKRGLG